MNALVVRSKRYKLDTMKTADRDKPWHPHSLIKIYTVQILFALACDNSLLTCVNYDKTEQIYKLLFSLKLSRNANMNTFPWKRSNDNQEKHTSK